MKKIAELSKRYLMMVLAAEAISAEEYEAGWNKLLMEAFPDYAAFAETYGAWLIQHPDDTKKLMKDVVDYTRGQQNSDQMIDLHKMVGRIQAKVPQLLPQIKKIFIELYEDKTNNFYLSDLMKFEYIFDKSEIQNFIIKTIKTYDLNKDDPHLNTKITNFLAQFLNSTKIHPEVIARLLRQVNPERFARYYEHGPEGAAGGFRERFSDEDKATFYLHFFEKDKYTVDDVIWLIELIKTTIYGGNRDYTINYSKLRYVVDRATPAAQNLLRRILFRISKNNFFILDESMQPMGAEYQPLNVQPNERIFIVQGNIGSKQLAEKWAQIFFDYKIVPLDKTFND